MHLSYPAKFKTGAKNSSFLFNAIYLLSVHVCHAMHTRLHIVFAVVHTYNVGVMQGSKFSISFFAMSYYVHAMHVLFPVYEPLEILIKSVALVATYC